MKTTTRIRTNSLLAIKTLIVYGRVCVSASQHVCTRGVLRFDVNVRMRCEYLVKHIDRIHWMCWLVSFEKSVCVRTVQYTPFVNT